MYDSKKHSVALGVQLSWLETRFLSWLIEAAPLMWGSARGPVRTASNEFVRGLRRSFPTPLTLQVERDILGLVDNMAFANQDRVIIGACSCALAFGSPPFSQLGRDVEEILLHLRRLALSISEAG